jgi:hypothetical protein
MSPEIASPINKLFFIVTDYDVRFIVSDYYYYYHYY